MPPRHLVRWLACLLALGVCTTPPAHAQTAFEPAPAALSDDATPPAPSYDTLVREAIAAQGMSDFAGAHALFEQAHTLAPNARTLRGMGVASFQAREFVRALRELEAALVHPEKPLDSELRAAVEELRERARREVGVWTLRVEPVDTVISVDEGPPVVSTEPLVLEPGLHTLRFSADGFVAQHLEITVVAGSRDAIGIRLAPVSEGKTVRNETSASTSNMVLASAPSAPVAPRERTTRHRRLMISSYSLLGLSATAGIASFALFLTANSRIEKIARVCREEAGSTCSQQQRDERTSEAKLETIERSINASLGIAGAALVGAGALLGWDYIAHDRRLDLRATSNSITLHGRF